jgi:DNA-directed RNA polymerase subunit RPC12/RpoP
MIRFSCPTCRKALKAPDDGAGRKIPCPQCGQRLLIPPPEQSRNKTVLGNWSPDSAGPMPLGAATVQWQPSAAPPIPPVRRTPQPPQPPETASEKPEWVYGDLPYAAEGGAGDSTTPEPSPAPNAVYYDDPPPRRKWLLPVFIGGAVLLLACSGIAMLGVGFLSHSSADYQGSPPTESNPAAKAVGCLFLLIFGFVCLLFYLLPTFVAVMRKHPNMPAIIILNVLLGWTLIGWTAALVWSFTNTAPPTIEIRNYGRRSKRRRVEE